MVDEIESPEPNTEKKLPYELIGRATTIFNVVEQGLHIITWLFISPDQESRGHAAVTERMNIDQLLDLQRRLIRHEAVDVEYVEALREIIGRADKLRQERNSLIHSVPVDWQSDSPMVVAMRDWVRGNETETVINDEQVTAFIDHCESLITNEMAPLLDQILRNRKQAREKSDSQ